MKWKRQSGSIIVTNDEKATTDHCKAQGWDLIEEPVEPEESKQNDQEGNEGTSGEGEGGSKETSKKPPKAGKLR